ncbi:hypothetical protein E3E22_07220 [Thermococcus sp. MV5]|uniref:oligosaccharide flippase family protein n=3 Tax=unclassified Thermococcus TaxID=2627626 RepID=UPI00143C3182|nr:oligosaccharide flippase family protein [Thermococcus sp. MV5]NJE26409.1 hypothetical protein [Thermococcus sp. MV5]
MKSMIFNILQDLKSRTAKQTGLLYTSTIGSMVLSMIASILVTRSLGPERYGIYSFYISVVSFVGLFFRFGVFNSAGLLLVHTDNEKRIRKLIGTAFILGLVIGVVYSLFLTLSSWFIDEFFKTNVGSIIRYTSLLLIFFPLYYLITHLSRGTKRVEILALMRILSRVVYLVNIAIIIFFNVISVKAFSFAYGISMSISYIVSIFMLTPEFREIKLHGKEILRLTKRYGIHVYLGQIADQSTYKLDSLFITYFVGTTPLGFYNLAIALVSPMVAFSSAFTTTVFREFARKEKIPRKILFYNTLWLIAYTIGIILFGKWIIKLLFTERFLPTYSLASILVIAGFFQGMYQPFGIFFESKGFGKIIRNISYITALVNVLGNALLIPLYGAMGAAVASALSKFIHLVGYLYYYRSYGGIKI